MLQALNISVGACAEFALATLNPIHRLRRLTAFASDAFDHAIKPNSRAQRRIAAWRDFRRGRVAGDDSRTPVSF